MYVYSNGERCYIGEIADVKPTSCLGERLIEYDRLNNLKNVYIHDGCGWALKGTTDLFDEPSETISSAMTNLSITKSFKKQASVEIWHPPKQPSTINGGTGSIIPVGINSEEAINLCYESLRNTYPGYITKRTLGKDQSNTWNIYEYAFTPENGYEKTIIISSCTHGNEYTGFYAIWLFLKSICENREDYPQLNYLRNNVRIIVNPIVNPWGFSNSQRQNSRQVDLNRNFDYMWSSYGTPHDTVGDTYYKGTAPFSEAESQILKSIWDTYPNATAYLDCHTLITYDCNYIMYVPRFMNVPFKAIRKIIDDKYLTGEKIVIGTSALPTATCYASYNYGFLGGNPEFQNGKYGTTRDSEEMTRAVWWYGNLIIQYAMQEGNALTKRLDNPFLHKLLYTNNGSNPRTVTSASYTTILALSHSFQIDRPCIVHSNGIIKITLSAPATVGILPCIYQSYNPEHGWTDMSVNHADWSEMVRTFSATGSYDIPIRATILGQPFNTGISDRPQEINVKVRVKTSAGTVTVEEYKVDVLVLPTDLGSAVSVYNATGKETSGEFAAMVTTFPDSAKFNLNDYED